MVTPDAMTHAQILSHASGTLRRRAPAAALLLLTTLGLASCAVGPAYRRADPAAPDAWSAEASGSPRVDTGARADLSTWWQGLEDPLLTGLVDEALRQGLDLKKAQARLREARARRGAAEATLYPTVQATASAGRTSTTGGAAAATGTQLAAGFDSAWEVDLFGGQRRSAEAARADLGAAQASVDDARVTLVAEVARNYVEVRSLQSRLVIARASLESQTETLALTEYRAKAGLASTQDAAQARASREQTAAQVPALAASLTEAEHRLDVLLGLAPGSLHGRLAGGGALPVVPERLAVGIPADTLRQRPDLRAAERTLAAETARVGVAEAARYPSLKLSGSFGLESVAQGGSGTILSLLAGLTAPIFDAGRLKDQAEAQDAIREQAEVAWRQAVLTALQEVEDALSALARSRERGEALARSAEAAREAAGLARQRYAAGIIDFQSVLDTERTALTVDDGLATARADEVLALIRLYKALGGGWPAEAGARTASKETP